MRSVRTSPIGEPGKVIVKVSATADAFAECSKTRAAAPEASRAEEAPCSAGGRTRTGGKGRAGRDQLGGARATRRDGHDGGRDGRQVGGSGRRRREERAEGRGAGQQRRQPDPAARTAPTGSMRRRGNRGREREGRACGGRRGK